MDRETLKLYARYNQHVNAEMYTYIQKLDTLEWEREQGGFFKSIRGLCAHLYTADISWLKRFSSLKKFSYIDDPVFLPEAPGNQVPFAGMADYNAKRRHLDGLIHQFVEELDDGDLQKNLVYNNFRGEKQDRNVGGLVMHIFNHQTHHRGMISLYLEMSGVSNDFSNLSVLV